MFFFVTACCAHAGTCKIFILLDLFVVAGQIFALHTFYCYYYINDLKVPNEAQNQSSTKLQSPSNSYKTRRNPKL